MMRRGLILALLGMGLAWPLAAGAEPTLVLQQLELDAPVRQVQRAVWQGQPVLSVVSEPQPGAQPAPRHLYLLRLTPQGLQELHRWPLPEHLDYLEPLRLPGGETGWLGWMQGRWHLGRVAGETLAWRPLCDCAAAYAPDHGPERFDARSA